MKRLMLVLPFILICLAAFSSCQKSSYEIYAYSDMNKYTMSMSVSPGLPVSIKITGDDYDSFTVTCKSGSILIWNDRTGTPGDKGDRLSFDKKEIKVYWSPDEALKKDSDMIIGVYKNGKKVYEKKYVIKYLGDHFFGFQGDE